MSFHPFRSSVHQVIGLCQRGEVLCISNRVKKSGESEVIAFLEPSGQPCSPAAALGAIASGLLEPGGDGLLGLSFSQTWRARRD
jgi:hypothetical protein